MSDEPNHAEPQPVLLADFSVPLLLDLRPALFSFHNQRNTYFDVLMNEMRLAILDTVDCQRLFPKPRQKV